MSPRVTASYKARTIAERDLSRLGAVCSEKDVDVALARLYEWIKSKTALLSFHKIKGFLHEPAFKRRFSDRDIFQLLLEKLSINEAQWAEIESISQKWASLHDDPFLDFVVSGITQQIVNFWGAEIKNYSKYRSGIWSFTLSFPNLHLHFFDENVSLIVITEPGAEDNQFNFVRQVLAQHAATLRVSILLVFGDGREFRELARKSDMDVVVIDETDCIEVLISNNSIQEFCHQVAGRISVQVIQPYQTQGKVRTRMFYGRNEEIKKIRSNLSSNFSVYGGRLVGKSSLLHQLGLTFSAAESSYKVCSITAQASNSVEVCRNILKGLDIPTANHKSILTFERLMRDNLEEGAKNYLVLLDEVDDLIHADEKEDFAFFNVLNNLNSDYREKCRFIIAGYRDLAQHCMNRDARLYNFGEKILLGNLNPLVARQLIEQPLCNELGFRFVEESSIQEIIDITSGHPNYIQVFCKELSEYLDYQKRRKIIHDDILAIFENSTFRARIIETFYVNFSPLQQLITALIILDSKKEIDLTEIVELLADYGYEEDLKNVYIEVRQLEMAFVLEQSDTKYRFVNKLFPELLEKSIDLYKLADHLMNGISGREK